MEIEVEVCRPAKPPSYSGVILILGKINRRSCSASYLEIEVKVCPPTQPASYSGVILIRGEGLTFCVSALSRGSHADVARSCLNSLACQVHIGTHVGRLKRKYDVSCAIRRLIRDKTSSYSFCIIVYKTSHFQLRHPIPQNDTSY